MNAVLYRMAVTQLRCEPRARRVFDEARRRGHTEKEAGRGEDRGEDPSGDVDHATSRWVRAATIPSRRMDVPIPRWIPRASSSPD